MKAFGEKNAPRWIIFDDSGKLKIQRRKKAALRAGATSLSERDLETYVQTKAREALIGD